MMRTLEVRYSTLRDGFALFGLLFYTQVVAFFIRFGADSSLSGIEQELEGNLVNQFFGTVTLLVPLYFFIRHRFFQRKSLYQQHFYLLLFLLTLCLSIFWSYAPMLSLKRFIALLSVVMFAGFLVYTYSLEKIALYLGCLIGISSLVALIAAVLIPGMMVSEGLREGAFKGVFVEKNVNARVNAIAIILLLPAIQRKHRWAIVCALFSLIALALAKSATGVLMIIAGVSTYWYFTLLIETRINRSRSAFFIATGLYLAFGYLIYAHHDFILGLLDRDPTLTNRTIIWKILEPSIEAEYLKGYGFGAFWTSSSADAFLLRWGHIGNAHNGYKETLLNGGIIQLAALIALFANLLFRCYRAMGNKVATRHYATITIIMALFAVTNYVAYIIPNYRSPEFLIFCILALALGRSRLPRHELPGRLPRQHVNSTITGN